MMRAGVVRTEKIRVRTESDGDRYGAVRNAAVLLLLLLALGSFLFVWRAEVTGFQVYGPDGEDAYCMSYGSIGFLTGDVIAMEQDEVYQMKMSCLPGGLEFHENSEHVDIDSSGRIHLVGEGLPDTINVFVIAEHESGLHEAKKFKIEVED